MQHLLAPYSKKLESLHGGKVHLLSNNLIGFKQKPKRQKMKL